MRKDALDWLAFMALGWRGPIGRWADRRVRTWFSADLSNEPFTVG